MLCITAVHSVKLKGACMYIMYGTVECDKFVSGILAPGYPEMLMCVVVLVTDSNCIPKRFVGRTKYNKGHIMIPTDP